mgnify:CR=1 FL=1
MTIPSWIEDVFYKYLTCEFTTISKDSPISYPVGPIFYDKERGKMIVTSAPAFSKKVESIKKNPRVSILFSNPIGSGLDHAPIVLVQGTAKVDDRDFEANSRALRKYIIEVVRKQPKAAGLFAPGINGWFMRKLMGWYLYRIIIEVTPETILAWKNGDLDGEPERVEVTA